MVWIVWCGTPTSEWGSGGFRVWWRQRYDSEEDLDETHVMRMAGRFSRRLRGWAKAHHIPVIYCSPGEDQHQLGEECLATDELKPGLSGPGLPSTGTGWGGAADRHRETRPVGAQRSVALREALFLSYLGPELGTWDPQNEWPSAF